MQPPVGMSVFEFVVVSSLRAAQLTRGCTPRIESAHKIIVMAQMEVAEHKVVRAADFNAAAVVVDDGEKRRAVISPTDQ